MFICSSVVGGGWIDSPHERPATSLSTVYEYMLE